MRHLEWRIEPTTGSKMTLATLPQPPQKLAGMRWTYGTLFQTNYVVNYFNCFTEFLKIKYYQRQNYIFWYMYVCV